MAGTIPILPKTTFALEAHSARGLYMKYATTPAPEVPDRLEFSEPDINNPYAKFQAEAATDPRYVHLKCICMDKYFRRPNHRYSWIVAGADQPDEDTSSWSCTLWEPQFVRHEGQNIVIRLLHLQHGHYALNDRTLYVSKAESPEEKTHLALFTVIDLERIRLPNPFVIKSNDNGGYLRCLLPLFDDDDDDQEKKKNNNINHHQILQFSEPDRRSRFAKFQVEQPNSSEHRDHYYVHIKSLYNNKYLRRMDCNSPLIVAAADQPDENKSSWTCTLFKPEHVEPPGEKNRDNKVLCRIRHAQTDLYTRPFVDGRCELQIGDKDRDPEEVDVYTVMPCTLPSSS